MSDIAILCVSNVLWRHRTVRQKCKTAKILYKTNIKRINRNQQCLWTIMCYVVLNIFRVELKRTGLVDLLCLYIFCFFLCVVFLKWRQTFIIYNVNVKKVNTLIVKCGQNDEERKKAHKWIEICMQIFDFFFSFIVR